MLKEWEGLTVVALIILAMSSLDSGHKDRCSFALVLALGLVIAAFGRTRP
jgi:hypothetical protein